MEPTATKKPKLEAVTKTIDQAEEIRDQIKVLTPDSVDAILDQSQVPLSVAKDSISIFQRISSMFKKKKKK